mgnify:CR=1 FL=1
MDLKVLQVFVAIVDSGSMSHAATQLNMTRSNVSRRVKQLEKDMRVQLLRRTTRKVEPTQVGWSFYEHADRIIREMSALESTVEDMGRTLRGHIRVSVPIGLGQMILGDMLLQFCDLHPGVTLQLTFSNRVQDLVSEEIDVAIRVVTAPPERYVSRELARLDWVICAAPSYLEGRGIPEHHEDLSVHDFLALPAGSHRAFLNLVREDQRHSIELEPKLQCVDMQFLKRGAIAGHGIAVLPYYLVRSALSKGELQQVLPAYDVDSRIWGRRLCLLTAPNLYPTRAVRVLTDYLQNQFEAGGAADVLMGPSRSSS